MKSSRFFPIILARLALTLLGLLPQALQAQTSLRYQFKEGQKISYVLDQQMKMSMNVMGNEITMNMNQVIDLEWKFLRVDKDGKAKMSQTFDRIRFTMEGGPMGKFTYDTKDDKDPDDPVGKALVPVFKAMVGSEFTLEMDSRGHLSEVKVPKKLTDALQDAPGAEAVGQMFSQEGFKSMIEQTGLILPETAISKGHTWMQKMETKNPFGVMKTETTLTYEGQETRNGVKLEQIAVKPKATFVADAGAPVSLKITNQDIKGMASFDNATGKLHETTTKQTMEMEVSAGGMTFNQKIEQTLTLKLRESSK